MTRTFFTKFRSLRHRLPRPTLIGRAFLLISCVLAATAICWTAAGITLGHSDGLIGIALLAWTLGLRHGLDADHIAAIDNATRHMVSMGRLPMTCGLFFSLGHSTIVVAVNIAIAVSVDVYDAMGDAGSIGSIVGRSVSSGFLFLVAVVNTYFLTTALIDRRRRRKREAAGLPPDETDEENDGKIKGAGCMVRIFAPILRAIDQPWKLYPVGILFGFGFDTASSIMLLSLTALATKNNDGSSNSSSKVVVLSFIFTTGMCLVDTLDSVLMLYTYAQPDLRSGPDHKYHLFLAPYKTKKAPPPKEDETLDRRDSNSTSGNDKPASLSANEKKEASASGKDVAVTVSGPEKASSISADEQERQDIADRIVKTKAATMNSLSISLTLLSIAVALAISIIQAMGLIGERCSQCRHAAEAEDGGGLAGRWWRAWALVCSGSSAPADKQANEAGGYIGAAIVGSFAFILITYHLIRYGIRRYKRRKAAKAAEEQPQDDKPSEQEPPQVPLSV